MFNFKKQLSKGQDKEKYLDAFFSPRFDITEASANEQRRGIDRHFKNKETGARFSVEYKTDWRAAETHNAFIETVSVDTQNKAGWAYTCSADKLLYYIPRDELVYVISLRKLRERLPKWEKQYRALPVKNDGYNTIGLLVPLRELEAIAESVINL